MENYFVGLLESGEWKWLAVVAIGVFIVVATILVSLLRGFTWAGLLALILGAAMTAAPIIVPTFLPVKPLVKKEPAADAAARSLALANQRALADLVKAQTEAEAALGALTGALSKLGANDARPAETPPAEVTAELAAFAARLESLKTANEAAEQSVGAAAGKAGSLAAPAAE